MKILLFSGGIESTCLAKAWQPDLCFTVDYGQVSSSGEITASQLIANRLHIEHEIARANLCEFGAGILSGRARASSKAPPEFWPFRNQMLITLAAMRFNKIPDLRIAIGTVKTDRRHPDGTTRFLKSMQRVLQSQRSDVILEYPAARMSTEKLVEETALEADLLGYTFSCHSGPIACGRCPGCRKNLALREWFDLRRARQNKRASHHTGSARPGEIAPASS